MILPSSIGMIIFVLRYEKDRVHEAIRKKMNVIRVLNVAQTKGPFLYADLTSTKTCNYQTKIFKRCTLL